MLFMLQFNLWFNLFMYFIFFCQKLGPDRIRKSCYSWYNLTCVFLFMSNQGNLKFFSTFSRLFLTFRCLTWFETNSYFFLPETRTGPDPQVMLFMLQFNLFYYNFIHVQVMLFMLQFNLWGIILFMLQFEGCLCDVIRQDTSEAVQELHSETRQRGMI